MLLRGTLSDKLQWLFRFYDTKKKGFLEKDDFQRILNSIYEMMSKMNSKAGCDSIDEKEHLDLVWSVGTFFWFAEFASSINPEDHFMASN